MVRMGERGEAMTSLGAWKLAQPCGLADVGVG